MRILILTKNYPPPPGGIQTFTVNIERGLKNQNHEVKVVQAPKERRMIDYVPRPNVLDLDKNCINRYADINEIRRKTKSSLEKENFDLVHAMHILNYPGLKLAKKKDIPTSVSIHLKELRNKQIVRNAIRHADHIHSNSKYTLNKFKSVYEPNKETKIIHPCTNLDNYRGKKNKSNVVFCLCRHVKRKNLNTLIKSWKILEREKDFNYRLKIAGEGPQTEILRRKAQNIESIEFLGKITEKRKKELLKSSKLFVMTPTKIGDFDAEGFGIVYLEAQAAGIPIVSSKRGGVEEAVGDAGLYVEDEKDPEETADKIRKALEEDTWNKLRENAQERIEDFTVESMAEEFDSWFREITDTDE
jgi:phosphatidylinositol alpha-1,6-mannosyltransferase